jgi:hypothetical protein
VAESKGTSASLVNKTRCPKDWKAQVQNIELSLHGAPIRVPRHIVVATRVNPNAKQPSTRCLQVRAWNSNHVETEGLPLEAAAEIASAHLFGLFRNLGLRENARALAASVSARARSIARAVDRSTIRQQLAQLRARADKELNAVRNIALSQDPDMPITLRYPTEFGDVLIEIDVATKSIAAELMTCDDPAAAADVMAQSTSRFEKWDNPEVNQEAGDIVLPSGIRVRFPAQFE